MDEGEGDGTIGLAPSRKEGPTVSARNGRARFLVVNWTLFATVLGLAVESLFLLPTNPMNAKAWLLGWPMFAIINLVRFVVLDKNEAIGRSSRWGTFLALSGGAWLGVEAKILGGLTTWEAIAAVLVFLLAIIPSEILFAHRSRRFRTTST